MNTLPGLKSQISNVKCQIILLLPQRSAEQQQDGEYLQTSDEHDEGSYPFGDGREGGITSAGTPLTDGHTHITYHRNGYPQRLVKTDTARTETQRSSHDDRHIEEHKRYHVTGRLLAKGQAVEPHRDDRIRVNTTFDLRVS